MGGEVLDDSDSLVLEFSCGLGFRKDTARVSQALFCYCCGLCCGGAAHELEQRTGSIQYSDFFLFLPTGGGGGVDPI